MMNKDEIIRRYVQNAFTHNYVFGFPEKGVYYVGFFHDFTRLNEITTVTVESGTGAPAVKFFSNSKTRRAIVNDCFPLCSVKEFESNFTAWKQNGNKGNRGNYFETLVIEKYHGKPAKVGANFATDCDVYIDGIPYQLKAYKASLVTYSLIENLPG